MARPLRIEYPGAYYHITAHGVARRDIFFEESDRKFFLERLAQAHERWGVVFHGYCLMANHYHLEVETPEGNLSRAIQWVNQNYASYINRSYGRVGHLFQGRFKSVMLEARSHLHLLTRYIHLNPVRAGLVERPADYKWSSYRIYLGMRNQPEWLEVTATLKRFGKNRTEQRKEYRKFVEKGIADDPLKDKAFGAVLGTKRFVDWARKMLRDKPTDVEVAKLIKARRPSLEEICRQVCNAYGVDESSLHQKGRKMNEARDVAIHLAREHSGCRLDEIGEYFGGISGSAAVIASKRIVERRSSSRSFRKQLASLSTNLKRV